MVVSNKASAASPRLLASYFTLAGDLMPFASDEPARFPLEARARAAAESGYVGLGIETRDLRHVIAETGFAGIRQILREFGLRYLELEVLTDWFADGERRAASDAQRSLFLKAAAELGVAKIKVLGDAAGGIDWNVVRDPWPMETLAREFAKLCREAATAGAAVTIELVPGTGVCDLTTARAIIEGAGEANGGLLVDIWHLDRCGIRYEDLLSLPQGLINAVEIDDARKQVVGTLFEDTVCHRKLPGEGELDVPAFLNAVLATGYDGYFGVEMVSDEHRSLSLGDAARKSFDATMKQFAVAASHRACAGNMEN